MDGRRDGALPLVAEENMKVFLAMSDEWQEWYVRDWEEDIHLAGRTAVKFEGNENLGRVAAAEVLDPRIQRWGEDLLILAGYGVTGAREAVERLGLELPENGIDRYLVY